MKLIVPLLFTFLLTGCAIFQTEDSSLTEPRLLKQSPLPPIPLSLSNEEIEIYCEMLINEEGKVEQAKLVKGSGDETWDYLAEQSLLNWEYSPALLDGKPVDLLVRRRIKVLFADSKEIPLAEIACDDIAIAESVYNALLHGEDFASLAAKYSVNSTKEKGGMIGNVNIQYYSKEIRSILSTLSEGEFTRPLTYGDRFVIFKRLKEPKVQELKLL